MVWRWRNKGTRHARQSQHSLQCAQYIEIDRLGFPQSVRGEIALITKVLPLVEAPATGSSSTWHSPRATGASDPSKK